MSMGAERTGAQSQSDHRWTRIIGEEPATSQSNSIDASQEEDRPGSGGRRWLAALLTTLAFVWLAAGAFALVQADPGASLPAWIGWIGTLSAPLVLLALAWLLFGRSARRETERFTHAVSDMRQESQALESVLAIITTKLEENRTRLSDEAARLMSLGDEASDRLGRVTHYLAREGNELERKSQLLDGAAANARVDIGVLMTDLPRVEEQARAAAESMRAAGLTAHEQAAALEGQLASLTARSRETDDTVGSSAQKLGAQIARIETGAAAAAERMDQAATQMNAAVDGAMHRASESIDQARVGLEAQGQALLALVEQSRAAFVETGAEASQNLSQRLDEAAARLTALAEQLAGQDSAARALTAGLASQIAAVEQQLDGLGRSGDEQNSRLAQSIDALRHAVGAMRDEVEQGQTASSGLIDRTHEMAAALASLTAQLRDDLPTALSGVETQAQRVGAEALAAVPSVEAIQAAAALAAESLEESEASVARQRESLDSLLASVRSSVSTAEEELRTLTAELDGADRSAARLAQDSGPQLVEALVRVRETASQAASHARDAITRAIPESVDSLEEASRGAIARVVDSPVKAKIAEISAEAERAVAIARDAGERLTRQLMAMGRTATALEARISEHREEKEQEEAEQLTRRVSLLIEALNSTSIDVGKILTNDVSDTAWAAYLKGDRGVFTRRAVRLLDSAEAREIQRHYEEEPDFRGQVNRYVHDFEAMLRRVLADREGVTLGVTLLSSDMGKLYVALAQAIDRLRRAEG